MSVFYQGLVIAAFAALFGSVLAWVVGTRVTTRYDERKRWRESDLASLRIFYEAYGQFFATWKLWDAHKRYSKTTAVPDGTQWRLLERAGEVEGKFESLLVKLATERKLSQIDHEMLGSFREAYQTLRECVRADRPLLWWASDMHADEGFKQYRAFKALSEYVALLIENPLSSARLRARRGRAQRDSSEAISSLLEVTSRSRYHGAWWSRAADRLHLVNMDEPARAGS